MRALRRSPQVTDVLCAPGNAGIAADAECLPDVAADDAAAIVAAAQEHGVDLAVIGPEAGLVAGAVDALEEAGIPAFGPTRAAAELEGSKAFAKELMREAGVPTAGHVLLRSREEAEERLAATAYPTVLKADGLAAGKGVIICQDEAEARDAVDVFFTERRFGQTTVVLEDFLEGEELSLLAICDGENVVPLAPAQDYKRIFDGDRGPEHRRHGQLLAGPRLRRRRGRGDRRAGPPAGGRDDGRARGPLPRRPLRRADDRRRGPEGARVQRPLRRPGDAGGAAATALRPRRSSSSPPASRAAWPGTSAEFDDNWAVTVVLASAGYPESSSKGDVISGLAEAAAIAEVTHAGTAERDGEIVTAGGRVLNVTGLGASPAEARDRAYDAARRISFEGMQIRTDIAARAVERVPS